MKLKANTMAAYVGLVFIGALALSLQGQTEQHGLTCKNCLDTHYQSARDNIIKVWTVVDLLRSITITPQARATFAHQMFQDVVAVMHDMAALASSCQFCAEYYKAHRSDLIYLEEILGCLMEAFSAVFTPVLQGEEKLLAVVMANIVESMAQIRQQVGLETGRIESPVNSLFKNGW